jgi:imidazolonepropionase
MRATRGASVDELLRQSEPRLRSLCAEGVTTVEIKSGYGLNLESERNMLLAARALGEAFPISVATTFLGAHAVPEEYDGRPDAYIDHLIAHVMPTLHREGLVDAVDAFCETIGFTAEQVDRLFTAARELGLPVKLHAEQLSDQGGTQLLARHGGLSADHLEYVSDEGVRALADSGAVAVLLPGAFYFLRETKVPPIEAFREAGVPMAISTDCNPGSSPLVSPLMTMNLACVQFRMTPREALRGMTVNAAQALGMTDRGTIAVGQRADLATWLVERPGHLAYQMGAIPLWEVMFDGKWVIPA